MVAAQHRWTRVNDAVSYFEQELFLKPWERSLRVVIYRKKVHHETRKNFQLDLFDPADGSLRILCRRHQQGPQRALPMAFHVWPRRPRKGLRRTENRLRLQLCAIASVRRRNGAWQLFSVLAFNLMRGFQISTASLRRPSANRRRPLFAFASINTLRYEFLRQAGLLIFPAGRPNLELNPSSAIRARFLHLAARLPKAA